MISSVRNTVVPPATAVDASTPASPSVSAPSTTKLNPMGKDEFLKMLVAQLKNQDPLNPMDGKDMAAQLAQFSTVEQLQQLNSSATEAKTSQAAMTAAIEALKAGQAQAADDVAHMMEGQMAMAAVGKTAVTAGNTMFVDGEGAGSVVVDTGTNAGRGRLTVLDAAGKVISEGTIRAVGTGQQQINLRDMAFTPPLAAGQYRYEFAVAQDGSQQWQQATTYTTGRITGLRYEQGNPILMIGNVLSLPMSKLTQIRG
jgi:flagellar basal-body rod modification protein FlgD